MQASAFGTRVRGGEVPANSGRTAWAYLACTKLAGLDDKENELLQLDLGSGVQAAGIDSSVRTFFKNGALHSRAVNTVASVQIGDQISGVTMNGIRAVADTWHDADGFHRATTSTIASITIGGVPLDPTTLSKGEVVDAGVAKLTFFGARGGTTESRARSNVRTVKIDIDATNTSILVGNAFAQVEAGFPTGILSGSGRSLDGSVLDGTATTGKVAVQPLHCRGTNGEWITNKTAGATLTDLVHVGAATASARGNQRDRAHGYGQTRGRVARATIGARGTLVIKGVVGAANVTKRGDQLVKTAKGTRVASITYLGDEQALPTPGDPLKIPGLAKLTTPRADKSRYGISVIALRVELLPGTNTVLNLGVAKANLKPR